MKYKLAFALVASITSTAHGSMPSVLPEFKNEKQLADWRTEQTAKSSTQTLTRDTVFYTGKPYVESSGNYAFKYRSYSPELARWTSADPSGYPDGANCNIYSPTPTNTLDRFGLSNVQVTGIPESGSSSANFSISSVGDGPHSIGADGVAQAESEISFSVNNSMSGWIVQRVVFDYSGVRYSDGSQYASAPEDPYWEAWHVISSSTVMGNISVIGNGNIDTFRTDPFATAWTSGTATITGKIDFYQDSVFNSANSPLNWNVGAVSRAPVMHATYSEPSWWTGSGFNHKLTMLWE